jgi:circadian clock protein KaiB
MHKLRLYVMGESKNSAQLIEDLRDVLKDQSNDFSLEVVDLLVNPQLAERDKIFATPTLMRRLPEPIKKIIGDLSTKDKILVGLDLLLEQ